MSEPGNITVSALGEPVIICLGEPHPFDVDCDACGQESRTLEVGEVHTYNHINICLDCLRQAIGPSPDLLAALEDVARYRNFLPADVEARVQAAIGKVHDVVNLPK